MLFVVRLVRRSNQVVNDVLVFVGNGVDSCKHRFAIAANDSDNLINASFKQVQIILSQDDRETPLRQRNGTAKALLESKTIPNSRLSSNACRSVGLAAGKNKLVTVWIFEYRRGSPAFFFWIGFKLHTFGLHDFRGGNHVITPER